MMTEAAPMGLLLSYFRQKVHFFLFRLDKRECICYLMLV